MHVQTSRDSNTIVVPDPGHRPCHPYFRHWRIQLRIVNIKYSSAAASFCHLVLLLHESHTQTSWQDGNESGGVQLFVDFLIGIAAHCQHLEPLLSSPGMVVARGNCLPACPPWVSSTAPLGDLLQCLQPMQKILRGGKRRGVGGVRRGGRRREGVCVCGGGGGGGGGGVG